MQADINLNFLYFLMATATCGAVPPLAASITWAKNSKFAAITCESCPGQTFVLSFLFMFDVLETNWGPKNRVLFMQYHLLKILLLWGKQHLMKPLHAFG